MIVYKLAFEVTHHFLNIDNYETTRIGEADVFYSNTPEGVTAMAVEFMQKHGYLTEKQAEGKSRSEEYYSVTFSHIDEVTKMTAFDYDDILENHPEYFV